jgi:hypothetical protein
MTALLWGAAGSRQPSHIQNTLAGEPFVNLQRDGKMAKTYQVRDVKKAIGKLEAKHGKKG